MSTPVDLYHQDFYAWALATAERMRKQQWDKVDWEAVIEEIEDLARRDRQQLESRLLQLLLHLLKWVGQPERQQRGRSWRSTIVEQRLRLRRLLEASPSLRREIVPLSETLYADAVKLASVQTDLPTTYFPAVCPWTAAQLLDEDFWPETWENASRMP